MNSDRAQAVVDTVLAHHRSNRILSIDILQELWSGYGKIARICFEGHQPSSLITKHIYPPEFLKHPRGWNSDLAHQRKVRSYEVESEWYKNWAEMCSEVCRIPEFLGFHELEDSFLLVLEDLDAAGYPSRHTARSRTTIAPCLRWLARFHGRFLGSSPGKLWQKGTYWHLETRPEEWAVIRDARLKEAAPAIDAVLNNSEFKTIVHGDAKIANFCFGFAPDEVAMVDFQYVGGGCGMKDVVYFLGSCLTEEQCEQHEKELLEIYFDELRTSLNKFHPAIDADEVVCEWSRLYPIAWTDFYRFLMGWCPKHWKVNRYSQRLANQVIDQFIPS